MTELNNAYNVLFINPPSLPYAHLENSLKDKNTYIAQAISMPMGILYLSSVLEKELPNCNIQILDLAKKVKEYSTSEKRNDIDIDTYFAQEIDAFQQNRFVPDFIGISILFSTAHKTTLHITDALKNKWPNSPTIVGGMHASNAVEKLLKSESVDFVCRGEAESIISQIAQSCKNGDDLENIQGIIGKNKLEKSLQNGLGFTELAPFIDDLDEIPLPAWHLLEMPKYISFFGRARKLDDLSHDSVATIVATRGCPFQCTFCSSWTVHGRKMRIRSKENVIEELEILHEKYGVTLIIPEDDLFTVQQKRIIELCEGIAERFQGKIEFQFPNGLSVATLHEKVIEAFLKLDVNVVNIAIESGSNRVQREVIKKNCNLDKAIKVVQSFRDGGPIVRTFFILGFPGESREEMLETLNYAYDLPADWCNLGIAAPLIGSEMYEQLLERGNIDQSFNWDKAFFQERAFDTEEISAKELKDLIGFANLKINFFGNYNLRIGNYDRAIFVFNDILATYTDHLAGAYCIALAYEKKGDMEQHKIWIDKCLALLSGPNNGMAIRHLNTIGEEFPDYFFEAASVAQPEVRSMRSFWEPENTTGEDHFFF